MRIWLIDDEEIVRSMVKNIVELWGHTVREFATRNDTLIALENENPPDVLITDFNLGSEETCVAIIALAREKGISLLIVMSGDPNNANSLPDTVHFFAKPINFDTLKNLLSDHQPSA